MVIPWVGAVLWLSSGSGLYPYVRLFLLCHFGVAQGRGGQRGVGLCL